jgi:hypothetical protein
MANCDYNVPDPFMNAVCNLNCLGGRVSTLPAAMHAVVARFELGNRPLENLRHRGLRCEHLLTGHSGRGLSPHPAAVHH